MSLSPLFPWIGGKRTLKKRLLGYLPKQYGTYFEPFLGAGSLLLAIAPQRAVVNDINPWVILIYHCVRDHFDDYTFQLKRISRNHKGRNGGEDYFYKCVDDYNKNKVQDGKSIDVTFSPRKKCTCTKNLIKKAALFLFIIKFAFGAKLWYTPEDAVQCTYSKHDEMPLYNLQQFQKIHDYLKETDITFHCGDYKKSLKTAKKGDFVYLDPPYYNSDFDNNIARYSQKLFDKKSHEELKKVIDILSKESVMIMQSNSSCDDLMDLYKRYKVIMLRARRNLSYENKQAKGKNECIIMNYK